MKPILFSQLALAVALSLPATLHAQHGHLNAGTIGTNQNDRLLWANGADFVDTSAYVKTLTYTNGGRYAGYFQAASRPPPCPRPPRTPARTPPLPPLVPSFNSASLVWKDRKVACSTSGNPPGPRRPSRWPPARPAPTFCP